MTIPKITPYTGGVANPDGSQTQTEFTQNMFDQVSYEANLSTELNNTVDGVNDTSTEIDAAVVEVRAGVDTVNNAASVIDDAEQAAINANNAADTANQTIDYFEATVNAQFQYGYVGNISDHVGQSLPEADKLNAYQYPDDSDKWYGPIQNQSFPITIPSDPSAPGSGWALVNAATQEWAIENFDNSGIRNITENASTWKKTGASEAAKAGSFDYENGLYYDSSGAEYKYLPTWCYVLDDFGWGENTDPATNSEIVNGVIKLARGGVISSRSNNVIIDIDAPIDVVNRVGFIFPEQMVIRKLTDTVGSESRLITPSGQAQQTYTWNKNAIVNVIVENDVINYVIKFAWEGATLRGKTDSTVGLFDAPMMAYSTIERCTGENSKFYLESINSFQITLRDIRSRFSYRHFYCETGTSWDITRVACDRGVDGSSNGRGFVLGIRYTTMNSCAADGMQNSYEFFDKAQITMNGCGSESFGRLLYARENAKVVINGGKLEFLITDSTSGNAATPWQVSGNAEVTGVGFNMSIENFSSDSDEVAAALVSKPAVTDDGYFNCIDCKHPVDVMNIPRFSGDKFTLNGNPKATWSDGDGATYYTASSSRNLSTNSSRFQKQDISKAISTNNTWSTVATFDLSQYGSSFSANNINIDMFDVYGASPGLVGTLSCKLAGVQESSGGLVKSNLGFDKANDLVVFDFSPSVGSPDIDVQAVNSGTNVLLQIKVNPQGGSWSGIEALASINYTGRVGSEFKKIPIS